MSYTQNIRQSYQANAPLAELCLNSPYKVAGSWTAVVG
jgi:hypothetical protein